ncbi:MAG: AAA family ATPase [Gemmataceae bacterium]
MPIEMAELLQFEALCDTVFSPSTPINRLSLFAGRPDQLRKLREAINTRGCHAIIYGDKGVGKTSLTRTVRDMFAKIETLQIAHINCAKSDDFQNAWRKALHELTIWIASDEDPEQPQQHTVDQYMVNYPTIGPGEIKHLLRWATGSQRFVIVFDEFNLLPEPERALFADTIKDLSDHSIEATVVLVGVASDTAHLIAEHSSITRCLRQIPMPLMKRPELTEIIDKALPKLGMTIEPAATRYITSLSQGLPNYTHLLGKESALRAFRSNRRHITISDVLSSVDVALEQVDLTIRTAYHKAVTGLRVSELFPQVLLATALANTDPLGWFRATDVRDPLCRITGQTYEIPGFKSNLDKLATAPERGQILTMTGTKGKLQYRFSDPLLRPYIILKRLEDPTLAQMILNWLLEDDPAPEQTPENPPARREQQEQQGGLFDGL